MMPIVHSLRRAVHRRTNERTTNERTNERARIMAAEAPAALKEFPEFPGEPMSKRCGATSTSRDGWMDGWMGRTMGRWDAMGRDATVT